MPEFDLFTFYRTTLFVFLAIYGVLMAASGGWKLAKYLAGADQRKQVLRTYLSYQLLTIKLKPLRGELIEIAVLLAALAGIWLLHGVV